jgi:hypothetical protein
VSDKEIIDVSGLKRLSDVRDAGIPWEEMGVLAQREAMGRCARTLQAWRDREFNGLEPILNWQSDCCGKG